MAFKTATVNSSKVAATLADFPSYIDWSRVGIATLSEAQSARVYADEAKVTEWSREVVSANEGHTKLPSLTTTTPIYVDYDGIRADYAVTDTYGRNAVWSNGYNSVSHAEESSGTRANSQGGTDLTQTGTINNAVGKIGNAVSIVNGTNYLEGADGTTFDISPNLSLSCWIYLTTTPGSNVEYPIINKDTGGASQRSYTTSYLNNAGTPQIRMGVSASGTFGSNAVYSTHNVTLAGTTWYKLRFQFNSANSNTTKISYFVDGVNVGNGSMSINTGTVNSIFNSTTPTRLATYSGITNVHFVGRMDEIRFETLVRSNDWETTEYNNQSDEAAFWGTWTDLGGGPTPTNVAARRLVMFGL